MKSKMRENFLSKLTRGAQKTYENAAQLFKEARLLQEKGYLSRSLFLHQISLEECAKVELMGTLVVSLLINEETDTTKLLKEWAKHKVKNYTNAYMLQWTREETKAFEQGDWKSALQAFEKLQTDFHHKSNGDKNASLYVDFRGNKFVSPNDKITRKMVTRIAERNKDFLTLMFPKVRMLLELEADAYGFKGTLVGLKYRLEKLRSEMPNDPKQAFLTLLQEMSLNQLRKKPSDEKDTMI